MPIDFSAYPHARELSAEGHLIDSGVMSAIMDRILQDGGTYQVLSFEIGRTNDDVSRTRFKVLARTATALEGICEGLHTLGCAPALEHDAALKPAEKDWVVPDDFYATTNHVTEVRLDGQWVKAGGQRMDAVLVCLKGPQGWDVTCRKLREVRQGDLVACGYQGIRIHPEFKERDREEFAFMDAAVSSERRVRVAANKVARVILEKRRAGQRVGVTAGPVVIHTGGAEYLARLVRDGYVDFILSGNALAVHDVEQNLYRTSLGIDVESGNPVEDGHRNHLRAINAVFRHGSIAAAVEAGAVRGGVFYECVKRKVPYVLCGSIRDDGPLPEVITDMLEAQKAYARQLDGCGIMLILSSMLHGIGVGNMLPGWVKTICVDINPAVVTKLADRGSHQTIGIVTEVGTFLSTLYHELKALEGAAPTTTVPPGSGRPCGG